MNTTETKWAIERPDFRATEWAPTKVRGEAGWEASICEELIEGRWEGFVSIRRARG